MGVDPYSFVSALNGIVAQRLVRLLCPQCIIDEHPADQLIAESGIPLEEVEHYHFRFSKGCGQCRGSVAGEVPTHQQERPVVDQVHLLDVPVAARAVLLGAGGGELDEAVVAAAEGDEDLGIGGFHVLHRLLGRVDRRGERRVDGSAHRVERHHLAHRSAIDRGEAAAGVDAGVTGRDVDGGHHAADDLRRERGIDRQAGLGEVQLRQHLPIAPPEALELAAHVERGGVLVERVDLAVAPPLRHPGPQGAGGGVEDREAGHGLPVDRRERAADVERAAVVRGGQRVDRTVELGAKDEMGTPVVALNAARWPCDIPGAPSSGASSVKSPPRYTTLPILARAWLLARRRSALLSALRGIHTGSPFAAYAAAAGDAPARARAPRRARWQQP